MSRAFNVFIVAEVAPYSIYTRAKRIHFQELGEAHVSFFLFVTFQKNFHLFEKKNFFSLSTTTKIFHIHILNSNFFSIFLKNFFFSFSSTTKKIKFEDAQKICSTLPMKKIPCKHPGLLAPTISKGSPRTSQRGVLESAYGPFKTFYSAFVTIPSPSRPVYGSTSMHL